MRNLKKFLALVLAFMMAMSLMVTADAKMTENSRFPDSDTVIAEFDEDVTVMTGMGVIQGHGDTGTFAPKAKVTRAQMAAIVYRLATGDASDARSDLYKEYNSFKDVKSDAWYAGYIGYCADAGYIVGYPDGTFKPNAEVSGYAALAMILRAMGYNEPGHKFEGANWKAETGATATQRQMLVNINKSIYANTLSQAAPRELVAEMAFQGATKVMVQYTNAYGYQTTGMPTGTPGAGRQNPSLGKLYYGLTCHYGVIVGNEATGETDGTTKIGFTVGGQDAASDGINDVFDRGAYVYESGNVLHPIGTNPNASTTTGNVTLSFNWNTDLTMFNHAVKVWYDYRGTTGATQTAGFLIDDTTTGYTGTNVAYPMDRYNDNLKTYALYDKVVNTAVVSANDADLTPVSDTTTRLGGLYRTATASQDWQAGVVNNWKAPGFSVRATDGALWNYSFSRMNSRSLGLNGAALNADNAAGATDLSSPVKANDSAANWPLYLLISNSANGALDVVIPLDLTFTQITQRNTTTGRQSVGVTTQNGTGADYFDLNDQVDPTVGADYSSIANANLRNSPKTDLRTKVAAIEITGTAGPNAAARTGVTTAATFGYAQAGLGLKTAAAGGTAATTVSTFYYQLTENTRKETFTVTAVDYGTQDVTLSDGKILHQSVFAEAVDGSFIPTATTGATSANEASLVTGPTRVSLLQAGRDYTFTLDEQGNYIYWETAAVTSEFVYGTYIDYETVPASSTFNYPLVYVNSAGEGKQKANITGVDYVPDGTVHPMNAALYGDNTTNLPLPKRNFEGGAGGNTSGFRAGKYVGYSLDSSGVLRAVGNTAALSQGTGFKQADATDFGAGDITISPSDVVLGTKPFGTAGQEYYLTENTQFYLVTGAGMDNQAVTPYKGLAALMEGMDSVKIDLTAASSPLRNASTFLAADATPYDMAYFRTHSFTYDQSYGPSAREVLTVYLPIQAVTFNRSMDRDLVFIGDSESKLTNAQGNHATKFDVVRNGVIESIWMDGWVGAGKDANKASDIITTIGDNVFYRILDTGLKAADGQPIYTIRDVTLGGQINANNIIIGKYFTGVWTPPATPSDLTGTLANATATTTVNGNFYATTYSQQVGYINTTNTATSTNLRNIGNAQVLSLNSAYVIENVEQLCGASSLTSNIGVPVSCVLNTEDVTHLTVSYIYVNA